MDNIVPAEMLTQIETLQSEFFWPTPRTINNTSLPVAAPVTQSGVRYYNIPSIVMTIDKLRMLYAQIWVTLNQRSIDYILERDVNEPPVLTVPTDYCVEGNQIRIYSVPNDAYPLEMTGMMKIAAPVNDADHNFWTEEAAQAVRHSTLHEIYQTKVKNAQKAQEHLTQAEFEKDRLHDLTAVKETTGIIKPYGFDVCEPVE